MILRRSHVAFVALFFAGVNVAGATGYRLIEGWSWSDCMYMTIITISAVGFDEVHPLSEAGRVWTSLVLAGGLTGLGMWFAVVTAGMVRMDLGNNYAKRRKMKRINNLKNHVIVCGGGRMGMQMVRELDASGQAFVVIDRDSEAERAVRSASPEALVIADNATRDQVLVRAGIERAKGLVTCLSADADNLYLCLSARHLNPDLVVVARADDQSAVRKMYRAGANHVVSPNVTSAVWAASVLLRPAVAAILDITQPGSHLGRHVDIATVGRESPLVGQTLAEARIPDKAGLVVIGLRRAGGDENLELNPSASAVLGAGDDLIVMGDDRQVARLRAYVG